MEIQLLGKSYSISRLKLREWLILNTKQIKISESLERHDANGWSDAVCSCLSFVLKLSIDEVLTAPWYEVVIALNEINTINALTIKLPFLEVKSKPTKTEIDYENRMWFQIAHTLAKNYGWKLSDIAELDVDDASAMLQEILFDEQLRREWEYSLTEIAYPYDPSTKKSVFKPLQRPAWMIVSMKPTIPQRMKIPVDYFPQGYVIRYEPDKPITN